VKHGMTSKRLEENMSEFSGSGNQALKATSQAGM
jgi:hypothetical protein